MTDRFTITHRKSGMICVCHKEKLPGKPIQWCDKSVGLGDTTAEAMAKLTEWTHFWHGPESDPNHYHAMIA